MKADAGDELAELDPVDGERCSCGRLAVLVYITPRFGRVPWCGEYGDEDDTVALEPPFPVQAGLDA